MKTGLFDKNGVVINVGDKTRLVLDDGEIREFDVCLKTVKRTVKSHPDFDDEYAKVAITGIVFCWNGYDLFPCIDKNGISDVSKMEVIKNTSDLGNGGPTDRLAEYEDTGLTPEQIREIDRLYAEKCKELAEINKSYLTGLELANIAVAMNELKKYKALEKEGKLIQLPCAVGDTVYYRYDEMKIVPMRVEKIIIAEYGTNLLLVYCGNDEKLKYWKINIESAAIDCKIIFLTGEEAKAALKEQNQGTV